ncbi:MAG: peptidoglycan-binding protein [Rhodospirillales bacterium]|nr:peptidoglycan-binding protein [Rhodospirillales bacterium]
MLNLIAKILAALFKGTVPKPAPVSKVMTTAERMIRAAERCGAKIARGEGEVNIIYVEGADFEDDPDSETFFKANGNAPNKWNDVRAVVMFDGGTPYIHSWWQATTEPGTRYTVQPINASGAARIKLGYQECWQVGTHRGYEALAQWGNAVVVKRDKNKDYKRDGDAEGTGWYGINQHHGWDAPENNIGANSAGCLVGRTIEGHREFMALVKTDPRYIANKKHVFGTTVIEAAELDA